MQVASKIFQMDPTIKDSYNYRIKNEIRDALNEIQLSVKEFLVFIKDTNIPKININETETWEYRRVSNYKGAVLKNSNFSN